MTQSRHGKRPHPHSGTVEIQHLKPRLKVADLVDRHYNAYNAGRLREICHLMERKIQLPGVTVGVSLSGALIPAGIGAVLIPMMEKGFIDYIVSTGANLYHDLHFALGYKLYRSTPFLDDIELHQNRLIRIYDIILDLDDLLETDRFVYQIIDRREFQRKMSTAELHYMIGRYVDELERRSDRKGATLLGAAYRCDVPIYTPSPGDSTIGLNIAARALIGGKCEIDVSLDVNETCAIVWDAKRAGKSAVVILGGGSPKNFILQTEPQLQEIFGLHVKGHDYFVQVTDSRPDTGGLSGATPSEAVSWGKVDPDMLPDAVVCYGDSTIVFPLVGSYVLERCKPLPLKRLYSRRERMLHELTQIVRKRQGKGLRSPRGTISPPRKKLKGSPRRRSS